MRKPKAILIIYDNMGRTFDRYSVFMKPGFMRTTKNIYLPVLGLSNNPTHPQGFSQWGEGIVGADIGIEISWNDLPEHIQRHILYRLREE